MGSGWNWIWFLLFSFTLWCFIEIEEDLIKKDEEWLAVKVKLEESEEMVVKLKDEASSLNDHVDSTEAQYATCMEVWGLSLKSSEQDTASQKIYVEHLNDSIKFLEGKLARECR